MQPRKKKFLTVQEVAEFFGVNPMTIYRKANKGEIPAFKFGKNWMFSEAALNDWVAEKSGEKKILSVPAVPANNAFDKIKPILLVYHFGSTVSGKNTPLSDLDIAYLDDSSADPFDFEIDLESCVRNALPNAPRIDLVRLTNAPATIKYKVIRAGQLLYARSENIQLRFEEETVMQYLDYEPVLAKFYREVA